MFRSAVDGNDNSFGASSINAPAPDGASTGDLEILVFTGAGFPPANAPTHNTPAGWTLQVTSVYNNYGGAVNARVSIFTRIAPSTPSTVTLSNSDGNSALAFERFAYAGMQSIGAVGTPVQGVGLSDNRHEIPSVTTTAQNATVWFTLIPTVNQNYTPVQGDTTWHLYDPAKTFFAGDLKQVTPGATGIREFDVASAADWYGFTMELQPTAVPIAWSVG